MVMMLVRLGRAMTGRVAHDRQAATELAAKLHAEHPRLHIARNQAQIDQIAAGMSRAAGLCPTGSWWRRTSKASLWAC